MDKFESWQYSGVFGFTTNAASLDVAKQSLSVEPGLQPIGATVEGTEITGSFIRVALLGFTSDVLSLDVRVVRGVRGFVRDPSVGEIVLEGLYRSSGFAVVDFVSTLTTYYYTIFYKIGDAWVLDPVRSFAKCFAATQYETEGVGYSRLGNILFDSMPEWMRADDAEETNTLYSLCQIIGRVLDYTVDASEDHRQNAQSAESVDAGKLPYLDWLIGWPTNYEFPEVLRRRETINALDVWKRKGARVALENVLQRLTGWNVTILEGWKWVIRTASDAVLPDDPPVGWDEETDGDWYELRKQVPELTTVGEERVVLFNGVPVDMTPVLPSNTGTFGRDDDFKNDHGYLVILTTTEVTKAVQEIVLAKLLKILPLLLPFYSTTVITFAYRTFETWTLLATDEVFAAAYDLSGDETFSVNIDLSTNFFTPDVCDLRTAAEEDVDMPGVLNDRYHWSPHADVEYTCGDHRVVVDAPFGWYELGVTP